MGSLKEWISKQPKWTCESCGRTFLDRGPRRCPCSHYVHGCFPPNTPEAQHIKRLAAKCGRTIYKGEKHAKAREKLLVAMTALDVPALRYWATVVMIDNRYNGATGQGGFWAAASACCNELASAALKVHSQTWRDKYGDAMFVTLEGADDQGRDQARLHLPLA